MGNEFIQVRGARVHNLKNISFDIPHNALTVVTGVSGSGKSSLAFDTIYAEGQRRYIESMSAYARQFLERIEKPDADEILGIAPGIAIRQKNTTRNPRSTVATATEIYDYLRLLFARVGRTYCASCGQQVRRDTVDEVAARVLAAPPGTRFYLLFPVRETGASAGPRAASPAATQLQEENAGEAAPAPAGTARAGPDLEALKTHLFELRKAGFTRLFQDDKVFEFSTPESLLDIDFSRAVHVLVDRVAISDDPGLRQRVIDSVEICYRQAGEAIFQPALPVGQAPPPDAPDPGQAGMPVSLRFSEKFECKKCGIAYEDPEPRLFSFNSPYGACPRCQGFGNIIDFDLDLVIPNKTRTLEQGAIHPWTKPKYRAFFNEMKRAARAAGVRLGVPFCQLSPEEREFIIEGAGGRGGRRGRDGAYFPGIRGFFDYLEQKKYKLHVRVFLARYRGYTLCPECQGARLRKEAFLVRIAGHDIGQVCRMSIEEARGFFLALQLTAGEAVIADKVLEEIRQRLEFLLRVGLEYLTLDRLASTLAGGEAQRIQLASSLGSRLVGALYVLDEPSIGLHPRDTNRLIDILGELRNLGNTIVVVEHDPDIMRSADRILDLGPGAGENGGRLVFSGTLKQMLSNGSTLTGRYLKGELRIAIPQLRRQVNPKRVLKVVGAYANNLKNIDLTVPLGMMVAVTGVSGSGKSTLVHNVIYQALRAKRAVSLAGRLGPRPKQEEPEEHPEAMPAPAAKLNCRDIQGTQLINEVALVDQSPIGRTPRSNPVTYIKAFDAIRELFASTPDAVKRGYSKTHFSFNIPGGRCEACQGDGTVTVEMQFLADVELVCEECGGKRFKSGVLEITWNGKNVHQVLQLTVREALSFFAAVPKVVKRLKVLDEVGLGYLRLGQSATTLSGGEAQRVKLAGHLAQHDSEETLYIFDEPTTGLHFDDIGKLLVAFRRLIEQGGSILIIEHNLEVIKTADWVIDLGPEGGEQGGHVVVAGTPEAVARFPQSHTGRYLAPVLRHHSLMNGYVPSPRLSKRA
jgi:excinuclease ABC subunit A